VISQFKKVLFFADGAKGEQAALNRAQELAGSNSGKLVVIDVVAEVSTNDLRLQSSMKELQRTLIRDRAMALDELIARLPTAEGKRASIKRMVVPGKDYIEVIRTVVKDKFDVVIKAADPKSALTSALFGNNDIRLLHQCPCPVIVLKPTRRKKLRQILAAVDPVTDNKESIELNRSIMESAVSLAEKESADLHVLHVWDMSIDDSASRVHKDKLRELSKSLKEDTQSKFDKLVGDYSHPRMIDHLLKGKPHKVIRDFVSKNNIDILVMGTVARSGVPGFIVGNTAEKIINQIDCSVMALKPRKWKSPIK
jgi:nucleotide-binding universal stress UspA family protein